MQSKKIHLCQKHNNEIGPYTLCSEKNTLICFAVYLKHFYTNSNEVYHNVVTLNLWIKDM